MPRDPRREWARQGIVLFLASLACLAVGGWGAAAGVTVAADGANGRGLSSFTGVRASAAPRTQPSFPIAVWFESVTSATDIALDRAVGINTYVVLTADSRLDLVRGGGMRAFVQSQERTAFNPQPGAETIGWELHDEIDMQMSPADGYAELQRIKSSLPSDGRLRFNNFGKGVIFWETDAEARRYVRSVDIASADIYWFTDPGVCERSEGGRLIAREDRDLSEDECRRAANYGAVVDRMQALASPGAPIWAVVELGHPFSENEAPTITPPQIRAAVWHSLIAGASGVLYFNHSFGGACQSQHVLREPCYAAVRGAVRAINRQVSALTPVLSAPSVTRGWKPLPGTKAALKWHGGHFYLLAGSAGSAVSGSFSIPCIGDATAVVLGENRSVAIRAGALADSFADGNAVHIYRVDGGSTCGRTKSR